jgi:nitrite reductase/ring-hydroxylating ferredoxin subunit/uncharacterized membrane protein
VSAQTLAERLAAVDALDHVVGPARRALMTVLPRGAVKDTLHGVWLGHPLHPVLTDLPIGFWTSAFVLDMAGGRRARPAADMLIGLGLASAVPTAAAGLADWSELDEPERRTGAVHGACNVAAVALYASSLLCRRRDHRIAGVTLSVAGAAAATIGGYLGGHLTFRRAAGVDKAAGAPAPTEWTAIQVDGSLAHDRPSRAELDGEPLAAVDTATGPVALYGRCSHLGGPLADGDVVDGCLRCPWHSSRFRLRDGSVARGPATAPQPVYELRVHVGRLDARRV